MMKNRFKSCLIFALVAMGSLSAWAADSEPGHWLYFKNTNKAWTNVYLRIGRSVVLGIGAYTSTWPMTRFGSTDFWYVDTENWSNAQVWTITDTNTNNGDSKSPYDLPSGANRLYYYNNNIEGTVVYVAGETTPSGTDASGVYYWGNYTHTTIPPAINGCSNCFMVY